MIKQVRPAMGMYTVHKAVQQDMAGTFQALAAMGYDAIEFYGALDAYDPAGTQAALRESGLTMTGWHVDWRDLQPDRLDQTLATLERFECPVAVVSCLGGRWHIGHEPEEESLDVWLRYGDWMNELWKTTSQRGIGLGYHNHDHEFALVYDGKTVFDWFYCMLAPEILMELDTGNCIEGGGNPADALARYAGRGVLLHMKPYAHAEGFNITLGDENDANDWRGMLCVPGVRFEHLIIESEAQGLSEMENARLCAEAFKRLWTE